MAAVSARGCTVRSIETADRAAWLDLWHAYCAFYETAVPDSVTQATWERIIASDTAIDAIVAVERPGGEIVGFANYVVHPYTWSARPACYLEDLYVHRRARGAGAGRALIAELLARCDRHDWSRLYWMTRESNAAARRLYDRMAQRDDFVRYAIERPPRGGENR